MKNINRFLSAEIKKEQISPLSFLEKLSTNSIAGLTLLLIASTLGWQNEAKAEAISICIHPSANSIAQPCPEEKQEKRNKDNSSLSEQNEISRFLQEHEDLVQEVSQCIRNTGCERIIYEQIIELLDKTPNKNQEEKVFKNYVTLDTGYEFTEDFKGIKAITSEGYEVSVHPETIDHKNSLRRNGSFYAKIEGLDRYIYIPKNLYSLLGIS